MKHFLPVFLLLAAAAFCAEEAAMPADAQRVLREYDATVMVMGAVK